MFKIFQVVKQLPTVPLYPYITNNHYTGWFKTSFKFAIIVNCPELFGISYIIFNFCNSEQE